MTGALTSSSSDMLWSTVVSRGTACVVKANSLMNNNLKSFGAPASSSDFVIPHKLTSDWTKDHNGHGQAHGARGMRGRGSVHVSQFGLAGSKLQHKSLIEPVFLAYGRVSAEMRYTLIQIATAVSDSLGDDYTVDAVQPMHTGW